tara:strand:- start:385 stop:597 length:213 start_codon:yes stop_codon:yes gene_type:complete
MPLRKVLIIKGVAGTPMIQAGEEILLPELLAERYVFRGIAEYAEGVKPPAPPAKRAQKGQSRKAKTSEKR